MIINYERLWIELMEYFGDSRLRNYKGDELEKTMRKLEIEAIREKQGSKDKRDEK